MVYLKHNHTDYTNSLLGFPDSVNKVETLIKKAYDLGLSGIGITEHEGISSHIKAMKYVESMELERDFKVGYGNEIYLLSQEEDEKNREGLEFTPYYHFLLTALNKEGHKQIRLLSSRAWIRAYTSRGLMRRPTYYNDIEEIIKPNKGNVVASTACLGSYLDKQILAWKNAEANGEDFKDYKINIHNFIKWCIDVFGKENFFLEIQPASENNEDQKIVNQTMLELSTAYELKIIPTTDSHYLSKDQAFIHKTFLNSKDGDREVDDFYSTAYLMGEEELRCYLRQQFDDEIIDQMFANTMEIHNRIENYSLEHAPMIPQIPIEKIPPFKIKHNYERFYERYQEFAFYAHHTNYQDQYFFYRMEKALKELVEDKGKNVETYIDRLNNEFRELRLISEAFNDSMASYYTSMSKNIGIIDVFHPSHSRRRDST